MLCDVHNQDTYEKLVLHKMLSDVQNQDMYENLSMQTVIENIFTWYLEYYNIFWGPWNDNFFFFTAQLKGLR